MCRAEPGLAWLELTTPSGPAHCERELTAAVACLKATEPVLLSFLILAWSRARVVMGLVGLALLALSSQATASGRAGRDLAPQSPAEARLPARSTGSQVGTAHELDAVSADADEAPRSDALCLPPGPQLGFTVIMVEAPPEALAFAWEPRVRARGLCGESAPRAPPLGMVRNG